jgi:hypothetical protein
LFLQDECILGAAGSGGIIIVHAAGVEEAPLLFYVVLTLTFVQAFSRAWFINHFTWRMQSNPNFGSGMHGHLSHYCLKHTYVMSRDLEVMENGRYKTHPALAQFM